jgi:hypothetical protein
MTTEKQGTPSPQSASAKPRLWPAIVTGVLFFCWLAYLIFLVFTLPHAPGGGPVILSRPQFLVSDLDIVAQIEGPDGPVVIREVFYPKKGAPQPGQRILVTNLAECGPYKHSREGGKPEKVLADYTGPGLYILALRPTELLSCVHLVGMLSLASTASASTACLPGPELDTALSYKVVPTPPSPGYWLGAPRIYHAIPATLAQLKVITAEKLP